MAQTSVLVIEDNRDIAEMVVDYLEEKNFVVDYAADGVSGLHLASTGSFDVVVLDLMLPGIDGVELCKKLRVDARRDVPVLMLTARDTLPDKVDGLNAGADDYLVKPFELAELDARLRALVRRHRKQVAPEVLQVGDLIVDTGTLEVSRQGTRLELPPISLRLLIALMKASPRVVTRHELEREIWGELLPDSDTLRSHLYNLRKVVDKPFATPLIHTLPGSGYRMAVIDDS